jgi:hypothetical protein
MPMLTLVLFCAHTVLVVAAVLVVGRRRFQRMSAAVILVCAFILEWFAPVDSFWRAMLALGGMFALMATITVAASATPQWSVRYRLLHLLTLGYPVRAGRIRPVLSRRIIGRLIVEGLVGGAAFLLLRHIAAAQHPPDGVIAPGRLVAGIILLYAVGEFVNDLIHFCCLASGAAMRPIQETPIAARSLRDFWGKRWNHPVGAAAPPRPRTLLCLSRQRRDTRMACTGGTWRIRRPWNGSVLWPSGCVYPGRRPPSRSRLAGSFGAGMDAYPLAGNLTVDYWSLSSHGSSLAYEALQPAA